MAVETSPAFQFYVKEWRSSRAIMRMTFAQRGMYLEMLLEQWENLTLPDDPGAVAEIIGGSVAEWQRCWEVLRRKFVSETAGRIFNLRLERVREELRAFKKHQKKAGRAGGLAKARNAQKTRDISAKPEPSRNVAVLGSGYPKNVAGSSSASATATATASSTAEGTARSKRPIFSGQRLTVFEWMLDDCIKTLGPLTEAFDLHSWFFDLDAQAALARMAIPQRDGGAWLQSQLVAEAQRRGLPIAAAGPVVGKQTTRLAAALANIKAEAS